MLKDKLGLNDKDAILLSALMHEPDISQQELAAKLSLSQPSVNARLRKLKERGIVATVTGFDAKRAGVALARVDCTCSNADKLLQVLHHCSFFVNGFELSGTRNVSLFLVGDDLKKVEHIVNKYLRMNPQVENVEVSVVVDVTNPFICAVDVMKEHDDPCKNKNCKDCSIVHNF